MRALIGGRVAAGAVACLLFLAACAAPSAAERGPIAADVAGAATEATPETAGGGPSADPGTAADLPGPAAPDDPAADGRAASWLPVGPASPSDPPPNFWYSLLQNRDCATLAANDTSTDPLWSAATVLCTAVTTGEVDAWARVSALLPSIPAPADGDCLGTAVYATLHDLTTFHEQHPDAALDPTTPRTDTACPLELTGVSNGGLNSPDPDPHTSVCGGEELRLTGRFLTVTAIEVGGMRIAVRAAAENTFYFTAPAASAGTHVLSAWTTDGRLHGSVTLTFDGDPASCVTTENLPSPIPNPAPTPPADTLGPGE